MAKLKKIQVRNERDAARIQDEMRALDREAGLLTAEAELLAAEAQIRPSPANPNTRIRTVVNIRSSNREGVTLNGVHNPQGIWVATRSMRFGSDNTQLHRGSILVFDGSQYHVQNGVVDTSEHDIQRAIRAGCLRHVEDAMSAPEAVLDVTEGGAMSGFALSMRNFGNTIRSGEGLDSFARLRPGSRIAKPKPKKPKEPERRPSWERLDDDEF